MINPYTLELLLVINKLEPDAYLANIHRNMTHEKWSTTKMRYVLRWLAGLGWDKSCVWLRIENNRFYFVNEAGHQIIRAHFAQMKEFEQNYKQILEQRCV